MVNKKEYIINCEKSFKVNGMLIQQAKEFEKLIYYGDIPIKDNFLYSVVNGKFYIQIRVEKRLNSFSEVRLNLLEQDGGTFDYLGSHTLTKADYKIDEDKLTIDIPGFSFAVKCLINGYTDGLLSQRENIKSQLEDIDNAIHLLKPRLEL